MEFEWDEAKNRHNVEKHGIGFARASAIFDGFIVTREDRRFDYGERRSISVGQMADLVITTVVHTDRDGTTRIISARRSNRHERAAFKAALQARTDG